MTIVLQKKSKVFYKLQKLKPDWYTGVSIEDGYYIPLSIELILSYSGAVPIDQFYLNGRVNHTCIIL